MIRDIISVFTPIHKYLSGLLSIIALPLMLLAGTNGKISGVITDSETGTPLTGVNVQVEGTLMGATTDNDGYYVILNVPVGQYTLTASMVGYRSVRKNGVRVSSDFTTAANFVLSPSVLESDEAIEVVAQKPMIRRDQTASVAEFSGREMREMPVETYGDVLKLQAGVTVGADGALHVRGGRANEITYMVDGISVMDEYSGLPSVAVENNAIEEISLVSGAFNAEYGKAMSGVVNIVTREGGASWDYSARSYLGDYLSGNSPVFMNINSVNPLSSYNLELNAGGPLPLGFRIFTSARYYYNEGWLYGRRDFIPSDSTDLNSPDPANWYIRQSGDSAIVPMNDSRRISYNAKLSRRFGAVKLSYRLLWNRADYSEYFHQFKYTPDGNYRQFQQGLAQTLNMNFSISKKAFGEVNIGWRDNNYRYSVFEDPLDSRYVHPNRLNIPEYRFFTGGTGMYYLKRRTQTYSLNSSLSWQVNSTHLLKAGFEVEQHNLYLREFFIRPARDANGLEIRPFKPEIPPTTDLGSNEYDRSPLEASAFIQDKIELQSVVINAGLRFDYFDANSNIPVNPGDPKDGPKTRASAKYLLSPRLGLAYPLTADGILHFSFGQFFQMPQYRYLYANPGFKVAPGALRTTMGNSDLKPQQTTIYELGFQQQFAPDLAGDFTLYVKDIRNLIGQEFFRLDNDVSSKYVRYTNRDFGRVSGISMFLEKRMTSFWGATLNYTYQLARGNASDPNALFFDLLANPPRQSPKRLVNLNWDQRHTLNGTLTVGDPGVWNISLIGSYGSGLPYTPSLQNQRTSFENSGRKPATLNFDLRATYGFSFMGKTLSLYALVYNVFDRLNEKFVYEDTGRAGYTLQGQFVGNTGLYSKEDYLNRPDFYSEPRRIVIGLQLQ